MFLVDNFELLLLYVVKRYNLIFLLLQHPPNMPKILTFGKSRDLYLHFTRPTPKILWICRKISVPNFNCINFWLVQREFSRESSASEIGIGTWSFAPKHRCIKFAYWHPNERGGTSKNHYMRALSYDSESSKYRFHVWVWSSNIRFRVQVRVSSHTHISERYAFNKPWSLDETLVPSSSTVVNHGRTAVHMIAKINCDSH